MRWVVRIEREDDGSEPDVIRIERSRMEDAAGLGLTLEDGKRIMALLQKRVLADQLREHCRSSRLCSVCARTRAIKANVSSRWRPTSTASAAIAKDVMAITSFREAESKMKNRKNDEEHAAPPDGADAREIAMPLEDEPLGDRRHAERLSPGVE